MYRYNPNEAYLCGSASPAPPQSDAGATPSCSGSTGTATGHSADLQELINRVLSLPQEDIAEVAHAIGRSQRNPILADITSSELTFLPTSESLLAHDSVEWLESRNAVLSSFLCGVSDCDLNLLAKRTKESEQKVYGVCKAVEQCYFNINPKCVLPHSFKENILIYSVSKSKLLPDALGGVSPAGTYYRLRKWLDHQAYHELPPLNGDVVIAFDNDQVVGKTYHVKADNKVRVSVITSICAFEEDGKLQEQGELKPSNWQDKRRDQFENLVHPKSEINVQASELHYKELYRSLSDAISEIIHEQRHNGDGKLTDDIDMHVSQNAFDREYRLCPSCSESNRRNKRICAYCGERLRIRADAGDGDEESSEGSKTSGLEHRFAPTVKRVTFTSESQVEEKADRISARDPFFVNPNSLGTIAAVFRHIGKDAKVKNVAENGDREWVCVVCDGLPYSIGMNILTSFYECRLCREKTQGQDKFTEHMTTIHPGVEYEMKDNLEFGWLLLHAGHGHYEMNAVRSFVSLNWDVFMGDAAKVMGFRSERAQKYAKSTSDHHRAWELLQIVYHGGLRELLLPYVRQCLAEGSSPTPEGYLRWSKAVEDRRYAYFQEQIMTYTQAIINLRKGLRTNNADLVMAGRIKHAPIFHGRNHPKYQAIEIMELANFLSAPPPVQEFLARHSSYSASGDPTKGEDLDFVLENLNKQSKDWIPRGVPTEHEWLRIFRNLDKLNEIRQETLHSMGQSTSSTPRSTSHDPAADDIKAWRIFIRESGYLSSPMTSGPISAINGEELDPSLICLTTTGTKRRRHFASKLLSAGDIPKPDPVLVTKSERADFEDISKQTKERISQRIEALISSVADDVSKDILMKELGQLKSRRKEELIGLFYRLKDRSDESDSDVSDD
ncbi:uncharacterized protein LOC121416832 isoform X2 [Lytechinus variegatus]|uniref:uncharacterized protein LOC121416832 isoform X2 n=1 Tax=Lytechinus variegatus TaxID=7654 RepID=UPI001BB241F4|nr:uncharacterized protein LOC121416832 isoform X2 [Lytechinus variegatus]